MSWKKNRGRVAFFVTVFYLCSHLSYAASLSSAPPLVEEGFVEEGWRYHASFQIGVAHEELFGNFDLTPEHEAMARLTYHVPFKGWKKGGNSRREDNQNEQEGSNGKKRSNSKKRGNQSGKQGSSPSAASASAETSESEGASGSVPVPEGATLEPEEEEGKVYTCMLRFTRIFIKEKEGSRKIKLGRSIKLREINSLPPPSEDDLDMPFDELIFRSGRVVPESVSNPNKEIIDLCVEGQKVGCRFHVLPPIEKIGDREKPQPRHSRLPLNLMFQIAGDSLFLEKRIAIRYPSSLQNTFFERGNPAPLMQLHNGLIDARREHLTSQLETLQKQLTDGEHLSAIESGIEELTQAQSQHKQIHVNPAANHYACAEQAGLNYILDDRIKDYLFRALKVRDPNTIGVLVNVHCSYTPCSTCATSFTRELEMEQGILRMIGNGKPVFLFCSCQNHYPRSVSTIGARLDYKNTTYLETPHLRRDLGVVDPQGRSCREFNISSPNSLPYPTVLTQYRETDDEGIPIDQFEIHDIKLGGLIEAS